MLKCCPVCQKSFDDIAKNGKMGCATCYTFFKNEILPIIEKIHGKTKHIGLVPLSADNDIKAKHEIQSLEKQLKDAIATQNFETAVVLRDKISDLKNKTDNKIIIDSNDDNSTPKSSR
ncbi:MAG: UvrB/UvrC motif-containing protein [Oscillospiraceae bacterium]